MCRFNRILNVFIMAKIMLYYPSSVVFNPGLSGKMMNGVISSSEARSIHLNLV